MGLFLNDDSTVTPNIDGILENSKVKFRYNGTDGIGNYAVGMRYYTKKTFGGSIMANTTLQGDVSNNPTEQSVYSLFFKTLDNTSQTIVVEINIEYIAVWNELKDIANS